MEAAHERDPNIRHSGQVCVGFLLHRGKAGYEAFTSDERSLGLFPTQDEAAAAIMRGRR
jgi:hypothetical protein